MSVSNKNSLQNLRHTPESNREVYCDLNGNELGEYASVYPNIDQLPKQQFTGKRITVLQISEKSQENNNRRVLF